MKRKGFTLVELLVVIGIIALLISILMPALTKAKQASQTVACQANMRQAGLAFVMYANDNRGQIVPLRDDGGLAGGGEPDPAKRWPAKIFGSRDPYPPVLICPSDQDPGSRRSYVLNEHVHTRGIRYGRTQGVPSTEIILLGEKKSEFLDYHMNAGQFDYLPEQFRHGLYVGSNYLYLDGHVASSVPKLARLAFDPWDPAPTNPTNPPPPPPSNPPGKTP